MKCSMHAFVLLPFIGVAGVACAAPAQGESPACPEPGDSMSRTTLVQPTGAPEPAEVRWHVIVNGTSQDVDASAQTLKAGSAQCQLDAVKRDEHHAFRYLRCQVGDQTFETMTGCSVTITKPVSAFLTLDERIAISNEGNRVLLNISSPDGDEKLFLECATVGDLH